MCLINFAFQQSDTYQFILVANRDEFYLRPTQPAHWWNNIMLAGKDLKDGGTWLGITRTGKFAALTNYRDMNTTKQNVPSRGIIIPHYLNTNISLDDFHFYLKTQGKLFNGFNLIYGNMDELFYFNNISGQWQHIYAGIYALSNAFLETPWPKVVRSKNNFIELLNTGAGENKFIESLHNITEAEENVLPSTGVPVELEKKLSAMFIKTENYGTRLTTFISVDKKNNVLYHEKSYVPPYDAQFEFTLQ